MEGLKTSYTIAVRDEDLDNGVVGDSFDCMAVRRIAKVVPNASSIQVDTQSVAFSVPFEDTLVRLTYFTPPLLQKYVIDFDAGEPLWPFRFRLKNPQVTTRPKVSKATNSAKAKGQRAKKQALEGGASPEEAKAVAAAVYQEVQTAAVEKAHAVHDELVAQGVENPVEKAAEAAGLLPAEPGAHVPVSSKIDPLFAGANTKIGEGERPPTPRVTKSRKRHYGQRALRINWPIDPTTGDRIKPEVTRLV